MIDFARLTPEDIARACDAAMKACDAAIAEIVATPPDARTFENTLGALEAAADHVAQAGGQYAFMAYVAADDALRETAREWEQRLDKYGVELGIPRRPLHGDHGSSPKRPKPTA